MPGREGSRAQGSIRPPAHVRCASGAVQAASSDKTEIEKKSSQKREPKAESIQARKGHVPGPNHQWDQVVRKSKQDWHRHKENHRGPMHGEHAVEDFG